jgi:hypothetical protein
MDRVDKAMRISAVDLAPQQVYIDIHVFWTHAAFPFPHSFQNVLARQYTTLLCDQRFKQIVFPRSQCDLFAAKRHPASGRIEFDVSDLLDAGSVHAVSAELRSDTGKQFLKVKWLGQVIVRTQFKSPNPVRNGIPGCQHYYWYRIAPGAQRLAHAPSIPLRQHYVQKDQPVSIFRRQPQTFLAIRGNIHAIVRALQALANYCRNRSLVFDQEDSHGVITMIPMVPPVSYAEYWKISPDWNVCTGASL